MVAPPPRPAPKAESIQQSGCTINMADTEFEEFRHCFERLPHNSKTTAPFYSIVPDILDEEDSPTSSKSDPDLDCDSGAHGHLGGCSLEDGLHHQNSITSLSSSRGSSFTAQWGVAPERRRRKLPEIPKNKKPAVALYCTQQLSLADELGALSRAPSATSLLTLKCGYLRNDEESSPDSERLLTDVDSGHSTAHSPTDGPKSLSPLLESTSSYVGSSGGGIPYVEYDLLEATHRGLHKFIPRHSDEIEVEIGDPIYVQKESDDLWCEGVNLRTGRLGIFPSAYAVDSDYSDWDPSCEHGHRERYQLGYLGSVETLAHKGTSVVCQAVRKVAGNGKPEPVPTACILEVSDQGLRMVDRSKRNRDQPCIDYFYSLKNVSFCAFHPRDHRYLGFITKHPTLQRFACHVFRGSDSTRPVAESVGRAFQRFYQKFIETAYPIEDIYIE